MSEIKRRRNESFEAFMRRAKREWQSSGKLLQAKKIKFFQETKSKNVRKKQRLAFIKKQEQLDYLRKIGRLSPEDTVTQGRPGMRKAA